MVGLLTLNSKIYNYGGYLQEMALQDAIESLGYQCEIIDYDVTQECNTFSLKRDIRNFTFDKIKEKLIKNKNPLINTSVENSIKVRREAFDSYRSQTLKLSEKMDYDKLKSKNLYFDRLVCGSDQIWNPDYNIPSFFLNFGNTNCKKIIYAASIGKNSLTKRESKVYRELLNNPDNISVREHSAQKLISELTETDVELVLDPTLLHDEVYWNKKADDSTLFINEDYVFCYFLGLSAEKVYNANEFAKAHNCKLITIPFLHDEFDDFSDKFEGEHLSNVGPEDFLNLIRNSKFVLTDSFHAVVFSIIFNKNFWCFSRNVGNYSMNTRLDTLLEYVDLQDRMISIDKLLTQSFDEKIIINFDGLIKRKAYSLNYLKESLK